MTWTHASRSFPATRLRRIREKAFARNLVREHALSAGDVIYPLFVTDQTKDEPVASMPGVLRLSQDSLFRTAEASLEFGIQAIALFPLIESNLKSGQAEESYNPSGLIPKIIQDLKARFPELGIITDIALDPYTSHGQDGLCDDQGNILNDETVAVLVKQAVCHAQAGADIVAPSDMMDGRIGAIRKGLDEAGFRSTAILSYAAKYASSFYGPFRDAVGSKKALGKSSKETYQLDVANRDEAMWEVKLDLEEGADIVMVKPGLPYLDIVRLIKDQFAVPTFAYHVSGEYAQIKLAAQHGCLDERAAVLEAMMCFKRAGADAVLTYFALDIARWLKEN